MKSMIPGARRNRREEAADGTSLLTEQPILRTLGYDMPARAIIMDGSNVARQLLDQCAERVAEALDASNKLRF